MKKSPLAIALSRGMAVMARSRMAHRTPAPGRERCARARLGVGRTTHADVAAHACADALFSAAGLGDLGEHFGTAEPQWEGAGGVTLLTEAARRVRDAGFEIGTIAVQVIGNRPRLGARRPEARSPRD